MTVPTFPTLIGLGYPIGRAPTWSTIKQEAISGKEYRVQLWTYPRYKYDVPVSYLGSGSAGQNQDWQTLTGFFNSVAGSGLPFHWNDPYDNAVTGQALGSGDGTTTTFDFIRTLGGFTEPVQDAIVAGLGIYKEDWQGNQSQYGLPRTNLLRYSQDFSQSADWSLSGVTLTSSTNAAPDGSNTAQLFTSTGSGSTGIVGSYAAPVTAGDAYATSFYVKAGSGTRWFRVGFSNPGSTSYFDVWFDLTAVAVGSDAAVGGAAVTASSITPMSASGWYRLSVAGSLGLGNSSAIPLVCAVTGNGVMTAVSSGDGFAAWGAQLEAGAVSTSYIPTTTAAVTVTDVTLLADPNFGLFYGVQFAVAPAAGALLTWTGSYNWACRFDADSAEFSNFMFNFWELKKISFETMKVL